MAALATIAAVPARRAQAGKARKRRVSKERFPCRAYWREAVLTRADLAVCQLDAYATQYRIGVPDQSQRTFDELIGEARGAAGHGRFRLGNRSNHAWVNLHAAEALAAQFIPEPEASLHTERALARLRATLKPEDPRRRALEEALTGDHADPQGLHANAYLRANGHNAMTTVSRPSPRASVISEAYQVAFSEQDEQYARVRSFRNAVLWSALGLVAFSIALAVVGWTNPTAVPLCFDDDPRTAGGVACPLGAAATRGDAALVGFLGSLGGALAAVFAVRRLQGTTTPYGVPLALAALKLPLGAITALVGLLFIHGQFVPGLTVLDTPGQILAYALVLGYAQQVVTRLVDRQGEQVLEAVPSKSEAVPASSSSTEDGGP